jgi:hypothetical protein
MIMIFISDISALIVALLAISAREAAVGQQKERTQRGSWNDALSWKVLDPSPNVKNYLLSCNTSMRTDQNVSSVK